MIDLVEAVMEALERRKWTIACAEACTAGRLAHALAGGGGASHIFLGSIVTYRPSTKTRVVSVFAESLARPEGAVSEDVAAQMARGAAELTGADLALATTGVAGPATVDEGNPIGRIFVALHDATEHPARATVRRFDFGDVGPGEVVDRAVDAALILLAGHIAAAAPDPRPGQQGRSGK
ncbi:CinA family protein [Phreatobacter sp.]|uniref:CinA family protein n=1 Tax=Phreatobacter sp. TaxID=1966341 RepID=UPI0025D90BD8|nr:CinA family protein [Phreatobacter sp.]